MPISSFLRPARRAIWVVACVSASMAVSLGPEPAQAQSSGPATAVIRLERGRTASDCPEAVSLARRINALAHRDAIVTEGPTVVLRVGIDHGENGYTASIVAKGARTGERDLQDAGPRCDGLAEALTVTIALLLDEDAGPLETPPPTPREPGPILPPEPQGPGSGPPPPSVIIDVMAVESAGFVGASTFGVEADVDFRINRAFTLGGGAFAMIDDRERFGAGELHLNLIAIRPNACFSFRMPNQSFGAALCGYPAIGTMIATARGFDENDTASQPWFALGAAAVADGPIVGPLGFIGRLDLVAPLVRPRFVVADLGGAPASDVGTAFRASPVGISVGLGVRAHIP